MAKRILILAAGVGSGHNMAAQAVEQQLAVRPEAAEVRRLDILDTTNPVFNRLYDDAYFALVAEVPWLVGWGYDNQDPPFKLAPLLRWWEQANTVSLVREIRDFDPDAVICTHFLPARLTSLMIARRQLHASLSVVTTDYDFQGLWLTSPFSHYYVARDETAAYLSSIGVPSERITASGIPVRAELGAPVDRDAVLARLKLDPDVPIILISAGAAGGGYALEVIRQTLRMRQRFQAVVVCGRNSDLRTEAEQLVAGRPEFRVLGFTKRMPDLMRTASLFVGKPGGLSASECMAAGLPMVIVNPIPGQEVRNADFLLESGAAVRCNYPTTVGYKLDALLGEPGRLAAMAEAARRIGRPSAAHAVADGALTDTAPALWISREAQKAVTRTGESGVSAVDLPADSRLRALLDPDTGDTIALVTAAQVTGLGYGPDITFADLSRTHLRALQWQPENLDLATTGKWLLGDAEQRQVLIR